MLISSSDHLIPLPPVTNQRQSSLFKTISNTLDLLPDWRPRPKRSVPPTQIVCFAGAGASASFFRGWRDFDGQNTQVSAYQPMGREGRCGTAYPSLRESTQDAVTAILAQHAETPDRRIVLFGHSYGALLAYEVAQALTKQSVKPAHLFVAARAAPQMAPVQQLAAEMSNTKLTQALRELGVKDNLVFSHPALGPVLLDILRHDLRQNASYTHCHDKPLMCPVTALSGVKDPLAPPLTMANWQACTTGPFFHHRFQGGHFFPVDVPKRLAHLIKSRISAPFMETLS
jgi:medium-chain acyl-[acyl-carrier-protein] hydrolase